MTAGRKNVGDRDLPRIAEAAEGELPSAPAKARRTRASGLAEFTDKRRRQSRQCLLDAAADQLSEKGYYAVSVEDIARVAGVSRVTFYRHFRSKTDILIELFQRETEQNDPLYREIEKLDYYSTDVVRKWIAGLFEADRPRRNLLNAFSQASRADPGFIPYANRFIQELADALGREIPAFSNSEQKEEGARLQYLEGWLILYEILDQSNQSAVGTGVASDPLVVDILAHRFSTFVKAYSSGS